jgi:hypothetical protein
MNYSHIHTIHKEKEKSSKKEREKRLLFLTKRGHFYLAQKGTFLNCVDTNLPLA